MMTGHAVPLRLRLGSAWRHARAALLRVRPAPAVLRDLSDHLLRDVGLSRVEIEPDLHDPGLWRW